MDRQIIYPGQVPLSTDLLNTNRYTIVAVAKLAAAMLGTATVVNGLACVPTGPASLQVVVNPGEMYSLANVDATAYGELPADTHSILKQGISLDAVTLSCPAPVTAGQSVNYLIQATYQDSDTGLVTLPYYNASNPSQAWSGPGNSGAQQATARKGIVTISAKAGVAATTGSQTTPAPDAGYTGLWVVTVANGQTQITAPNIVQATNAPILPSDLLHAIQANSLVTAVDTGSANTYVVSYSPAITALTDGMVVWFKAKTANTGASTLNVNGLGASPMVGGAHSALQGGEIVANGKACAIWRADISSWVLIECTGGALQVAAPTQSNHAVNRAAGDARYAALTGLATQAFDVGPPTNGASAVNLNEFFASLTGNGCVKIPVIAGGTKRTLIIQWGSVAAVPTGGGSNWTFPIAFPNAYLNGVASCNNTGGISGSAAGGIGLQSTTGATLFNNGSSGATQISAIVVGW